jgi:hypothetical protein
MDIMVSDLEGGSERAVLTGKIRVFANGVWFPAEGWTDLPAAVLLMWCEELANGEVDACLTCRFMDGPFELDVFRERVACSRRTIDRRDVVHEWRGEIGAFKDALNRAVQSLRDQCMRMGYTDSDVEAISRMWHGSS